MKKLFVCGDSWMSPMVNHPGTHFSEIFAKEIGFEVVAYAHPGMSNGGIAIQLDTAIKNKADFILFDTTTYDRIEFIKDKDDTNHRAPDIINSPAAEPKGSREAAPLTITDLSYHITSALSYIQNYNKNANLISDPIYNLLTLIDNRGAVLKEREKLIPNLGEKLKILKDYIVELYHPRWKYQQDRMMMYAISHKLHTSNIPYIYCFDTLKVRHHLSGFTWPWLEPKNNVTLLCDDIRRTPLRGPDPGYHTSYETQAKLAALLIDHYYKYY